MGAAWDEEEDRTGTARRHCPAPWLKSVLSELWGAGGVRGSLRLSDAKRPPHPARAQRGLRKRRKPRCDARHPLPQGERVSECAARSSRHLPGVAVLRILKPYAHGGQLVSDAIGFGKILRLSDR